MRNNNSTKTVMIFAEQDGNEVLRRKINVLSNVPVTSTLLNYLVPNYTRFDVV